jgi:hypothetical protein
MSSPKILAFHGRISDRPSALSIAQKALEDSPAESGSRGFVPHCSYKSQALAQGMQGDGYIGPTALRTDRLLAAAQVGQGGTIV